MQLPWCCNDDALTKKEALMSRLDPNLYPDRLAFESHARRLRSDELARLTNAAVSSLQRRLHIAAGASARAPRPSVR